MAPSSTTGNRPRPLTILTAAFLAGGAAAVGLNHFLDVHLSQRKPVVESEPIFIAMRSLPSGAPVTVWDVALRNWPKAMMPTTAMRVEDSFEGMHLKMPLREGQPLLSVQLESAPASPIAAAAGRPEQNGEMIVVDDRTKIQMSWPSPAADDSAGKAKAPPASTAPSRREVAPLDDRLAIRPVKPTAAVPAKPETAAPEAATATVALPEAAAVVSVEPTAPPAAAAVEVPSEPAAVQQSVTMAEPVASPSQQLAAAATVVAQESEPLPETEIPTPAAPQVPTPVLTQIVEAPAELPLSSVVVPREQLSSVPQARPASLPQVVTSQRHLVVPERIAVMVDEVTTAAQQRQQAPDQPATNDLRKPSPAITPSPAARPTDLNLGQSQQPTVTIGANPLRQAMPRAAVGQRQAEMPVTPRQLPAPPTYTQPVPQQVVRSVPPVKMPLATAAADPTTAETSTEEEGESRMFPRVSARLEKAGEDWSRFRQSLFGSSQE